MEKMFKELPRGSAARNQNVRANARGVDRQSETFDARREAMKKPARPVKPPNLEPKTDFEMEEASRWREASSWRAHGGALLEVALT